MARAFLGLLVVAALGVTGYLSYNWINNDGTCCHNDSVTLKRSCCQPSESAKTCCSESSECTSTCGQGSDAKCCDEKKEGCCEGKEGSCCKEKKDDGKKE
jgi:hypothetical protein